MPEATREFIIPLLNSTSRRSFLRRAGAIAATSIAGCTAINLALPAPADAAEAATLSAPISPALLKMMGDLDNALYTLLECCDDCNMRDRAIRAWEERNPMPGHLWVGEEGYNPTAHSDWSMRRQAVMFQLRLGVVKKERTVLNQAFNDAARRISQFEPTNIHELLTKASAGICTDNPEGVITKAVLRDMLRVWRSSPPCRRCRMKNPADLVKELQSIVFEIEDDILAVRDYGELMAFVTATEGHEICHRGMNRLAMLTNASGEVIDKARDRMTKILQSLTNP